MDANWSTDYARVASNALTVEWFVSPLEFRWAGGRKLAEKAFSGQSSPHPNFDEALAPELYKEAMAFSFRAKMMVYAFMREPIAKSFGLEIEGGLCSLYGLDFRSCIAQWIYVVEGYTRQLFKVRATSNVNSNGWTIPVTGDSVRDQMIGAVSTALDGYLTHVVYKTTTNAQTTRLSRHLMLHGNLQNNAFYSQKNALSLMFVLDALVFIEMVSNGHFPTVFQDTGDDAARITRRESVYAYEMNHCLRDENLRKLRVMDEHG